MVSRSPSILIAAAIAGAIALASCSDPNRNTELRADPQLPAQQLEPRQTTESLATPTVEVALVDHRIQMSAQVPAGEVVFSVVNHGDVEHSFEIEGQGIEESLPEPLGSHAGGKLLVKLAPGTYKVYCPIADHAERGMSIEVTAVPGDPTESTSPLGTPDGPGQ